MTATKENVKGKVEKKLQALGTKRHFKERKTLDKIIDRSKIKHSFVSQTQSLFFTSMIYKEPSRMEEFEINETIDSKLPSFVSQSNINL